MLFKYQYSFIITVVEHSNYNNGIMTHLRQGKLLHNDKWHDLQILVVKEGSAHRHSYIYSASLNDIIQLIWLLWMLISVFHLCASIRNSYCRVQNIFLELLNNIWLRCSFFCHPKLYWNSKAEFIFTLLRCVQRFCSTSVEGFHQQNISPSQRKGPCS